MAPSSKSARSAALPRAKRPSRPPERLTPAARLEELKTLLYAGWISPADVAERLEVSRSTAFRLLSRASTLGTLERETIDGKVAFRFRPGGRVEPLRVSTSEMLAIAFVKNALRFLAGTGIKEDLDEVFARITHALKKSDFALSKNLDRKLYDVNEAAYDYSDRIDLVNDILTALLREERLRVDFRDGSRHQVDPYTLQLYKKGLYLIGYSHKHGAVRSFSIDKLEGVEWCKGDSFEYPADYRPEDVRGDAFGLIRGPRTRVVVWFASRVAYYVERRDWHPTQTVRAAPGGVEMTMECEGVEEVVSWLLGFGSSAQVIEPPELRARVEGELRAALARYGGGEGLSSGAEPAGP